MTNKEMSEIFAIWMLAYPSAEMFKGGIQKLAPTVKLWTQCFKDLDFDTAQRAAIRLCKTSAFPPTIAEFEKAIKSLYDPFTLSPATMWAKLVNAAEIIYDILPCFRYTLPMCDGRTQGEHYRDKAEAIYNELPEIVKDYVGSYSAMLQLARELESCNGQSLSYKRDKFERHMTELIANLSLTDYKKLIPPSQIGVINEQIQGKKS
ncbi:MAG: replicative helicase loader/inhibitor [Acutalibacteraceae bacterium]